MAAKSVVAAQTANLLCRGDLVYRRYPGTYRDISCHRHRLGSGEVAVKKIRRLERPANQLFAILTFCRLGSYNVGVEERQSI
jgi:hypothetical protein